MIFRDKIFAYKIDSWQRHSGNRSTPSPWHFWFEPMLSSNTLLYETEAEVLNIFGKDCIWLFKGKNSFKLVSSAIPGRHISQLIKMFLFDAKAFV